MKIPTSLAEILSQIPNRYRVRAFASIAITSLVISGCSMFESDATPTHTSQPAIIEPTPTITNPETRPKTLQEILTESNISHGFFNAEVAGATSENIFTYPEKFGVFGTEQFLQTVTSELQRVKQAGRTPLLTLEPFKNEASKDVLGEIASGKHDEFLIRIYAIMAETGAIFRPMHEMEVSSAAQQERYPWAGKDPQSFIAAWKHMHDLARTAYTADQLPFLWSPAGEENMMDYYPGSAHVDIVGVSIYEYPPQVEVSWYGKDRNLAEDLVRKMTPLLALGKPIAIPELGIAANTEEDFLTSLELIAQTLRALTDKPISIYFFNSNETLAGFEGISFKVPQ